MYSGTHLFLMKGESFTLMSKFKNYRRDRSTAIRNAMLQNKALSLKAKGLLSLMMTYPEDWEYHMSHIEAQSKDGRRSHESALEELILLGYVVKRRWRDEKGHYQTDYAVCDYPHLNEFK